MAELISNPMEKFALYDAIIQYAINGTEPQFDESFLLARISWEGIKPQIDANTKRKYDGKKGGRPKEEIEKTSGYENKKPVVSEENNQWFPEEITSGFENKKPNDNVNENNNDHVNENIDYPTKEKILQLAKDPSVALSPEEAEKFFDHYTAQSWTRSNGQAIANTSPALISMLRMWKSNSVNFAPRQQTFSYGYSKSQGDGISLKEFKRKFVKLFDPNFMDVDADATDYLSQMILFVRRMQAEESIEEFKQKYFNEYTTIINRKDI